MALHRALLAYFFSGIGGLIFQVLWTRKLGLFLGSTVQSASIITASFLFGLSLGAFVVGEKSSKIKKPLLLFAKLELGIAVCGLATTFLIPEIHRVASVVAYIVPPAYRVTAITTAWILVMLPSMMMGATLPLLTQHTSRSDSFSTALPLLYAVNTLGAAVGAVSTDFYLVKTIGVNNTALLASGLDGLVSLLAYLTFRSSSSSESVAIKEQEPQSLASAGPGWALVLVAISGFCGLGLEISWTRLLVFLNGTDIYAYSLVLGVYLLGIVVGSILYAGYSTHLGTRTAIAVLLLILGLWVWVSFYKLKFFATLVLSVTKSYPGTLRRVAACLILLLVPTSILGVIFPAAADILHKDSHLPARSVGRSYLANTMGSVAGSLVAGFLVLPYFGLQTSLQWFASLPLLFGAWTLLRTGQKTMGAVSLVCLVAAWLIVPSDHLLKVLYDRPGNKIIYAGDDHYRAVAILEQFDVEESTANRNLIIDGYNMAGNSQQAKRYTAMLGALPVAFANKPQNALIVALGVANTLTTLESCDSVESIDCVELSERVVEALKHIPRVPPVLRSDKVNLIIGDGRHHLLTTTRKYDIITSEPPPPTEAGIVNLYSREYFELCRSRLASGGSVAHWLPVMQMSVFEEKTIIKAFQEVFPYTYLFYGSRLQLVLVGRLEPIEPQPSDITKKLMGCRPLSDAGVMDAYEVLASCVAGPDELRTYTAGIPTLTDDHPYLQYHDGQWTPDIDFLLEPREVLPPTAPAELREYKRALSKNSLLREYQLAGGQDIYFSLFEKTTQAKRLLEYSSDPWTQVIVGISSTQTVYLESLPVSFDRNLKLARIAYLRGEPQRGVDYLRVLDRTNLSSQTRFVEQLFQLHFLSNGLTPEERKSLQTGVEELAQLSSEFQSMAKKWPGP